MLRLAFYVICERFLKVKNLMVKMGSVENESVFDDSLVEPFSCPVCYKFMSKKIFTCSNGHSFCHICILKVAKCPICKVKIISRRNINLEKAAKKIKELGQENLLPSKKGKSRGEIRSDRRLSLPRPSYENDDKTLIPALRRKLRRSWGNFGSPVRPQTQIPGRLSVGSTSTLTSTSPPTLALPNERSNHLPCPISNCCYSTKTLWEIKGHLQAFHPAKVCPVKKLFEHQSEKHMRVRISWNIQIPQHVFVLSSEQAYFVIYITKKQEPEEKYVINVLTISDKNSIYKFSLATQTQFSMFYHGVSQATSGGIEVPIDQIERDEFNNFKLKVYISKMATLYEMDD